MNLQEMLDLLPDNEAGEITAESLRTIVTSLYNAAHTVGDVLAFDWTSDVTPAAGKLTLSGGWATGPATLHINEESSDGITQTFSAVDGPNEVHYSFSAAGGGSAKLAVTGPSVDQGAYRDIPVDVTEAASPAPANNEALTVVVVVLP